MYVDDFSGYLIKCQIGCHIDNLCVKHVMHADDIYLMAPNPAAVQEFFTFVTILV